MIASHYAEPVERKLARAEDLLAAPAAEAEKLVRLAAGETFRMLDDSLGWAWGYGGADAIVGYVPSKSLTR